MTDIADYIELEFGRERADRFEYDMKREIGEIASNGEEVFATTKSVTGEGFG